MFIRLTDHSDRYNPEGFMNVLEKYLAFSRFTARVEDIDHHRHRRVLEVTNVRLRERKEYCGQHPGPCQALFPRKHRTGLWLEGLDWVGFNELLNDVCEACSSPAEIWSYNNREGVGHKMWIRRVPRGRRWRYGEIIREGEWGITRVWDNLGQPGDFCCQEEKYGKQLREMRDGRVKSFRLCGLEYPAGTPGNPEWMADNDRARQSTHGTSVALRP